MKKLDEKEVKEKIEKTGYKLLGSYVNSMTPIYLECPKGHHISIRPGNFFHRNSRCFECEKDNIALRCKIPYQTVLETANSKNITLLTSKEEYEKNHKKSLKLQVICRCGKHRSTSWTSLRLRDGCQKCKAGSERRRTTKERLREVIGKYEYSVENKEYTSNKDKIAVLCTNHGKFTTMFNSMQQGHGCRKCGNERNANLNDLKRMPVEKVKKLVESKGGVLITEKKTKSKEKLDIQCKSGHFFSISLYRIQNGGWCPDCWRIVSCSENEIVSYIRSKTDQKIIQNDRKVLNGLELDIWIPSANFGIEFDGLYWHSERAKKDIKAKTRAKAKAIRDSGIKILAIFEDEWKDEVKKEIVKSMINSRLGIVTKKIFARKTTVSAIDKKEAKIFMEECHLDGHTQFRYAVGLKDENGKLVMCATFRSSTGKVLELARMASALNIVVVGGASKILSTINESVMSYSDNRMGEGNVYKQLGFKEITESIDLSYWYTNFKIRVYRTKCMRNPAFEGTEREQALAGVFSKHFGTSRPVYRIYDYGQRKWFLTKKS